jgi:hypothetical protein
VQQAYDFPEDFLTIMDADEIDDEFIAAIGNLTTEERKQLANMLLDRHLQRV